MYFARRQINNVNQTTIIVSETITIRNQGWIMYFGRFWEGVKPMDDISFIWVQVHYVQYFGPRPSESYKITRVS